MGGAEYRNQKRTKLQRELDAMDFIKLIHKGKSQTEIAEWVTDNREYNLTQQQVSYDIKKYIKGVIDKLDKYGEEHVAKELIKLNHIEAELWLAWDRSCEQKKKQVARLAENGKSKVVHAVVESSVGDPRFMDGILKCIDKRIALLNLVPQEKPNVTFNLSNTKNTADIKVYDYSGLTTQQLKDRRRFVEGRVGTGKNQLGAGDKDPSTA